MAKIAILYHSSYGHTEKLAQYVQSGAQSVENTEVKLIKASEGQDNLEYLHLCDAIIFGSPTYMGSMAAEMKKFMETTSKFWLQQLWKNKLAAGFTNSASPSGDKFNTLLGLAVFAAQHGMLWVSPAQLAVTEDADASMVGVNRLGGYMGVMAWSPANESPETAPPAQDLKTGELLGKRVAELAAQWSRATK